jgi:hypothetical protein
VAVPTPLTTPVTTGGSTVVEGSVTVTLDEVALDVDPPELIAVTVTV